MQLKLNNGQFISFDQEKMNLCYSHIQDPPCWNIYTSNSNFLKEVTDVWEERTPIKGFKFEEEPIVYLKKKGVWLVEH